MKLTAYFTYKKTKVRITHSQPTNIISGFWFADYWATDRKGWFILSQQRTCDECLTTAKELLDKREVI